MSFVEKLQAFYFDFAYNRAYDFVVARINRYQNLQQNCIDKLGLKDADKVLCVGLGTGNEIRRVIEKNNKVSIAGIDLSQTALRRAFSKARKLNKEIELRIMDARHLEYESETFNKVICLHVMDFVNEKEQVTAEIIRVLKSDGQFVITFPSGKEDSSFGSNLLKDSIHHQIDSGKSPVLIFFDVLAQVLVGLVCIPMMFRPGKRYYSREELGAMITALNPSSFEMEEEPLYHDFVISGRK